MTDKDNALRNHIESLKMDQEDRDAEMEARVVNIEEFMNK